MIFILLFQCGHLRLLGVEYPMGHNFFLTVLYGFIKVPIGNSSNSELRLAFSCIHFSSEIERLIAVVL